LPMGWWPGEQTANEAKAKAKEMQDDGVPAVDNGASINGHTDSDSAGVSLPIIEGEDRTTSNVNSSFPPPAHTSRSDAHVTDPPRIEPSGLPLSKSKRSYHPDQMENTMWSQKRLRPDDPTFRKQTLGDKVSLRSWPPAYMTQPIIRCLHLATLR